MFGCGDAFRLRFSEGTEGGCADEEATQMVRGGRRGEAVDVFEAVGRGRHVLGEVVIADEIDG